MQTNLALQAIQYSLTVLVLQVMIEEMQGQEAEFLKEQKEKKLKNRFLAALRGCYVCFMSIYQVSFLYFLGLAGSLLVRLLYL